MLIHRTARIAASLAAMLVLLALSARAQDPSPEQKKFSEEDIPQKIRDLMESDEEHEGGMDEHMEKGMEKPMK